MGRVRKCTHRRDNKNPKNVSAPLLRLVLPYSQNVILRLIIAMDLVWLVDMGYITKASKGRGKVDYVATRNFLASEFKKPCHAMIFNSVDSSRVELGLSQFYYTVKKEGFVVNLYPMEGGAQKQVDVAIASHMVFHALQGSDIALSSGDIDFAPAMQLIRSHQQNIGITLLTYNFGVHEELRKLATRHLFFEDHAQMLRP
jgi:uncharacterized LabA/DUF88 family protein